MDTKTKILFAARELFFRYGIKRITMDDIAKHLAVSKKTIYQFFEDKNLIVNSLCQVSMQEQEKVFLEISQNSKDPISEMLDAARYMTELFSKVNPVFFYDLQKFYPEAWKRLQEFKFGQVYKILQDNLSRGVSLGYYRNDMNIDMVARYRMFQVDVALNPYQFFGEDYSIAEVNALLLDNFMHGITTLKGHKLINKYKQIQEEE